MKGGRKKKYKKKIELLGNSSINHVYVRKEFLFSFSLFVVVDMDEKRGRKIYQIRTQTGLGNFTSSFHLEFLTQFFTTFSCEF